MEMRPVPFTRLARALLLAGALAPSCSIELGGGVRLVSIALSPADPQVALGTGVQLTARATLSDGRQVDWTGQAAWSSSDAAIATVGDQPGSRGLVTSASEGSATIRAADPATGIEGATTITVTAAILESLGVTPADQSIALGYPLQYAATGTFSDGSLRDLTDSVAWDSSEGAIASVGNAPGTAGLAIPGAIGATTIRATDLASGIAGSTPLTVTAATLVSIEVTPTHPSIALGTSLQLAATGIFSDASTQDLTGAVAWDSSDPAVATVDGSPGNAGLASSLSIGGTTVTATDAASGIAGATTLTVTDAVLASIAVTPTDPSIALGTGQQFAATGTFSDGTTQDLTGACDWTSSDLAIATVGDLPGSKGLAESVAVGGATITATDPGTAIAGSTALTVTPATLTSIAITPVDPSIALGTVQPFAATGTFSDGSTQDLTSAVSWTSSDLGVATISNAAGEHGLATSLAVGSTTIGATHAPSGLGDSTTLTVTAAVLVAIDVTPVDPGIPLGTVLQFTATGTYSDATTQDLTSTVTWSSSDAVVATIGNAAPFQGLATSLALGATTITATDPGSGVDGSTTLTITAAILLSIAVDPADPSIDSGATQQFSATGAYSDGSTADLTGSATWSSSDPAVATVSNASGSEGLATGVGDGVATITATDPGSGVAGSTSLTVDAPIAFRDASSAGAPGGNDLVIATPAGTQPGDLMVAAVAVRPSSAIITPPVDGWTLIRRLDNAGGATNSLAVYHRVAIAGEPASHTWSFSSSTGSAGGIAAFSGVDTAAPIDVEGGQSTGSGLIHATPSVTTSTDETMLVTLHDMSSCATWIPPLGMSEAYDDSSLAPPNSVGICIECNWVPQPVAGATGAKSAIASNDADTGNAQIVALRKAP